MPLLINVQRDEFWGGINSAGGHPFPFFVSLNKWWPVPGESLNRIP
jgi:hypothetical protein